MKHSHQIKLLMKSFGFLSIFIFLFAADINAKSTAEIDASIESAIERFTDEIRGGQTYLDGARGVLVIPKMIKAGLVLVLSTGSSRCRQEIGRASCRERV